MGTYREPPDIMNVREIIDTAFGDFDGNAVNFKLIQTVLYLLARQLRFLGRRVLIELGPQYAVSSGSSIQVTEVKIRAKGKDTKQADKGLPRKGIEKGDKKKSIGPTSTEKTAPEKDRKEKNIRDKKSLKKGDTTSPRKSTSDRPTTETSTYDQPSTVTSSRSSVKTTSSDKTTSEQITRKVIKGKKAFFQDVSDKSEVIKSREGIPSTPSNEVEKNILGEPLHTRKGAKNLDPEHYSRRLDSFETKREEELRVIHQRAYSYEEHYKTPTPIASIDSIEAQYEKLLVVERVPSTEAKAKITSSGQSKMPKLSIVTLKQFEELVNEVRKLQERFGPIALPGFPDNAELMGELRKGASLTDAMAALQLSARLEATEKALEYMIGIVTDIAGNIPGIEIGDDIQNLIGTTGDQYSTSGLKSGSGKLDIGRSDKGGQDTSTVSKLLSGRKTIFAPSPSKAETNTDILGPFKESVEVELEQSATQITGGIEIKDKDYVTFAELKKHMNKIEDLITKNVTENTSKSVATAERALKTARNLELKLEFAQNLAPRMEELEMLIDHYADKINSLDTGLTSQMTNYQEQLTQMQNDLEIGLETMSEALVDTGGDTAAITELNSNFTLLQADFDDISTLQKELKESQTALASDLENLWKEIEILRANKSDREEVTDALRDKAGIDQLNGLVALEHFEAVRGDFQKRIASAYDKFNNQEIVWQKAIDDLVTELNERADKIQLEALRSEINRYLNIMKGRIKFIEDIVGEPKAACISKKLFRDTACLSCGNPASMQGAFGETPTLPDTHKSRQPMEATEGDSNPLGDGDHKPCIPGLPIPHTIDHRAHLCQRYCGGSHTLISSAPCRVPSSIAVKPIAKSISVGHGTDEKIHAVDIKKPCLACNVKSAPHFPPENRELLCEEVQASTNIVKDVKPESASHVVPIEPLKTNFREAEINLDILNAPTNQTGQMKTNSSSPDVPEETVEPYYQ